MSESPSWLHSPGHKRHYSDPLLYKRILGGTLWAVGDTEGEK